uniref:Proteasome subunit beta n=1 Tax=Callorhinchus milii TaxID=7868 RepID=V9L9Z7_CALMI
MSNFSHNSDWRSSAYSTGTTIIAVEFNGGVIVASDSRVSVGGTYVCSRIINKVVQVDERVFCCMAGSLADAQAVTNAAKYQLAFHSVEMGEPPLVLSAATILKEICYKNRDDMSAGFIVAGWDRKKGAQVYTVSLGGMITKQPFTVGGSGSTYIYGYVDSAFKIGMTQEECLHFTVNALALAMERDNVSGGLVNLVIVTERGVERSIIPGNKLPQFFSE